MVVVVVVSGALCLLPSMPFAFLLSSLTGYEGQKFAFTVESDVPLCEKAYCEIEGLSLRSFQRWKRMVKLGEIPAICGRRPGVRGTKVEAARAFLTYMHPRMTIRPTRPTRRAA